MTDPVPNDPRLIQLFEDWRRACEQIDRTAALAASESAELEVVWRGSDFVGQAMLRDPAAFFELLDCGDLHHRYASGDLAGRLRTRLTGVVDEAELQRRLRLFRRREMMRIIWRDLAGLAPLGETLEDLSELADQCVDQALEALYAWAVQKDGTPRDREGVAQHLVVLGMGKLGARELNLSSDIDLIFAYSAAGQTDGTRLLDNERFFTRLGQALIKALNTATVDGFVFRVDMRLRPFGDAGALVSTFDALEVYYGTQARAWERYAMIKARVIAGDREAGENLSEMLRPFVYRRYIDFGAIESIRDMKRMIERELHRKGMDANIKLGRGGIREIEFIGQAFQLVRGGRDPDLQIRPILAVLRRLGEKGLLPGYAVRQLGEAYEFLRLTENRIQAWQDEQSHLLPKGEADRLRLAQSLNFANWDEFAAALEHHREQVHQQFQKVFATPHAEAQAPEARLAIVWDGVSPRELLLERLLEAGFTEPEQTLERLETFRDSRACRSLSTRGRQRLDLLMPLLLQAVAAMPAAEVVLERLLRLLSAISRRTAYLDLLVENPLALSQLVRLGSESSWVVSQLIHQPILLDELLDPRRLYSPLQRAELRAELDVLMMHIDPVDLEQQMERLRQFALGNRLRVAAADIAEVIPLRVVSDYLTEIAETVLERAVHIVSAHMLAKHGRPGGLAGEGVGFAVIGYGKLGGIELGYGSDLDMVFLHGSNDLNAVTAGPKSVPNPLFYARFGQRLVHLLTTRTPAGVLYEVDMRLRPNGNAGQLVSSLAAFEAYQRDSAWTWEQQALLRARPIAGDPWVMAEFEAIRRQILTRERDPQALRTEVVEMREKMRASLDRSSAESFDLKQGHGGIADIEFMVQYAVLRWASRYPDLLDWTDNLRLLEGLARHELLGGQSAELLANAYQVFRAVYHRQSLQEAPGLMSLDELREERQMVRDIWAELMLSE